MKNIIIIVVALAVLDIALFGCLYLFEAMETATIKDMLTKSLSGIVLLGACAAAISLLTGSKK
ncbi:MAG TPA: hypothetical protein VIS04_05190 [Woeseiaceae bacterium]|jgi:hypothetical protein